MYLFIYIHSLFVRKYCGKVKTKVIPAGVGRIRQVGVGIKKVLQKPLAKASLAAFFFSLLIVYWLT